jgi:hypothetical protein
MTTKQKAIEHYERMIEWKASRVYNKLIFFLLRLMTKYLIYEYTSISIWKHSILRALDSYEKQIVVEKFEVPRRTEKLTPVHLKVQGDNIMGLMPRVTKFVEYDLSADYVPIMHLPWSQFPEEAWSDMLKTTQEDMVKLWNKKNSTLKKSSQW